MTMNPVRGMFGSRSRLAVTAMAGLAFGLGGCAETDSYLYDPSVLGRWERTPTTVPILSRLVSIEGQGEELLDYTDPTEADLVPEVYEHRIGSGDVLVVNVFDLPDEGRTVEYQREVDPRGMIELPQLGQVYIAGMTSAGAEEAIKEAMKALIARPMASVLVAGRRSERYSVMGGVQTPGNFRIPTANFRLLEALASSGNFSEQADFIYIIRQVTLSDAASAKPGPAQPAPTGDPNAQPPSGERLIETINRLTRPEESKPAETPKPGGSPGMMRPLAQPELIELPPAPGEKPKQPPQPDAAAMDAGEMAWVNIDGKWVKVRRPKAAGPETLTPLGRPEAGETLMTQRIIRVPMQRLVRGDASVNIVIRAGDVIRIPPTPPGTVYLAGQVGRPGAYGLTEKLTLRRIIPSAGGVTSISAPEKVDLTRMIGPDRQATIRLNLRAIEEGTQPDLFLRGNDIVNVGSSFWALPLAVARNGFRMTYGFGFLADRNFGNDIFGAPPANQFGQ